MRALRNILRRWLGIDVLDAKTNTIAREVARLGIEAHSSRAIRQKTCASPPR